MRISDWSSDVCSSDLEVLRAVGYLARYKTWYDEDPAKLGANVRANYEQGLGMTLADFSRAHAEQTKAYRRVQAFFQEFDLLPCPASPATPLPWPQPSIPHITGETPGTHLHSLALTPRQTKPAHHANAGHC